MNDRISSDDDNENDDEEFLSSKNIGDISIDKYAHLKRRDSEEDDLNVDESIYEKYSDQDSSDSVDSSEEESNLDEIRIISFIKSRIR